MVLKESQRAFMYFNLFGVNVDAVIVNKIIPPDAGDCSYLRNWIEIQKKYVSEIESYFSPVPVFRVPLLEEEVFGTRRLEILSDIIYRDRDPSDVFFKEKPYEFIQEDGRYVIKIRAPFVKKESVSLLKGEDEIVVRVGNFKSHIMLPRKLRDLEPEGARIEEGYIYVKLR